MTALTISSIRLVNGGAEHQMTAPAGEAIAAGQYIRQDPSTGKFVLGNGTTAAEVGDGYIANKAAAIGESLTGFKAPCVVDVGAALAGLNFGDPVYVSDTDGTLDTAAGTVSTLAGKVVPGWAHKTADKLLRLSLQ